MKKTLVLVILLITAALIFSGCQAVITGMAKGGKPGGKTCTSNGVECGDCIDNDGDRKTDYSANRKKGDAQCQCAGDTSEGAQALIEVCDNIDNDCDNLIDESVTQTCETDCGIGTRTCSAGQFGVCSTEPPENYGETCTVGLGICERQGTIGCDRNCDVTQGSPQPEVCDGLDNDCDGAIDEGVCIPTGILYVTSNPTYSDLYVDGDRKGWTPMSVPNLEVGEHDVKVTHQGYMDGLTTAYVYEGNTTTINVDLVPIQNQTNSSG